MVGLADRGLTAGRDCAVIGFDNIAESAHYRPALTTIAIGARQIGEEAAHLLLRRIKSPDGARENVVLPPWIHTGSKLVNFTAARLGDELSVRARVADNYERKGHRLVDLDVLIIANGKTAVAQVAHTAVYQLRHLAEAK